MALLKPHDDMVGQDIHLSTPCDVAEHQATRDCPGRDFLLHAMVEAAQANGPITHIPRQQLLILWLQVELAAMCEVELYLRIGTHASLERISSTAWAAITYCTAIVIKHPHLHTQLSRRPDIERVVWRRRLRVLATSPVLVSM